MPVDAKLLSELTESSADHRLTLWIIFVEDRYETVFGDGYYSYPERAFFDKTVAERWAEWITRRSQSQPNTLGFLATVRERTLTAGEPIPAELVELLNTGNTDWRSAVDFCSKESGEDAPAWVDTIPAAPPRA